MKKRLICFSTIVSLLFAFFLSLETALPQATFGQPRPGDRKEGMERIAVMPFLKAVPGENMTETLDSPVSGFYFNYENVADDADRILSQRLQDALRARHGEKVVQLPTVEEVYGRIPEDEKQGTPRALAQKLGRELNATHVMIGMVWRYTERIGGPYGAERPASVAFAVYLIETRNGRLLWKAQYKEKQKSLSENLMSTPSFIKRRGRWLTAGELLEEGIKDIFIGYPY